MLLTEDRLMILKQSPRQCSITDIEDLCDCVEQLNAALIQATIDIKLMHPWINPRYSDFADTAIDRIQSVILQP